MFEIVLILKKWLKPIILTTGIVAVLTAGVSLLLDDYYESVVVMYPANPALLDRAIFSKDGKEKPTFMFGSKVDLDRILSLGKSSELAGYAVKQYQLFEHYGIKPDSKNAAFKVGKQFNKNFNIQKNAEGAIEVILLDKNPQKAADWVNDLAYRIDQMNKEIIFGKKEDQIKILETEVKNKRKIVQELTDSLATMVKTEKDTVSTGIVRTLLKDAVENFKNTQNNYDQNKAVINQDVETVYYFERATPAERKSKPKRSFIVLGATLFALFVMSLVAVFLEKFQEYKTEVRD